MLRREMPPLGTAWARPQLGSCLLRAPPMALGGSALLGVEGEHSVPSHWLGARAAPSVSR